LNIPIEKIKSIPKEKLLELIGKFKDYLKDNAIVKDMFEDYGVNIDFLDAVPVYFSDLDVSAQTVKGVIHLNYKLLQDKSVDNLFRVAGYMVHELTHVLQQVTGKEATENTDRVEGKNYLGSEEEMEAFKNQIEYDKETLGENEANRYVKHLLDYHEIAGKDREDLKEELLG